MKRKSQRKSPPALPGQLDMFASVSEPMEKRPTPPPSSFALSAPLQRPPTTKPPAKAQPAPKSKAPTAILRVQDAAVRIGVSVSTLNKMRGDGRGPRSIKLTGKIVGYAVEDLDAWLEKRRMIGDARTPTIEPRD